MVACINSQCSQRTHTGLTYGAHPTLLTIRNLLQVAKGLETIIGGSGAAEDEAPAAAAAQRLGAWLLLREVSAQEPGAPSWQFLQAAWAKLQAGGGHNDAAAQVRRYCAALSPPFVDCPVPWASMRSHDNSGESVLLLAPPYRVLRTQ